MSTHELTAKVKELQELKALAVELQDEITSIEDAIKAEMTSKGVDELKAGYNTIRWTKVVTDRFDSKAFKADHAIMYGMYTKTTQSRRFSIV